MTIPQRIIHQPYDVDKRLAQLEITRELLEEAARRGNFDRLSVPPLGFTGQEEYSAASRALSTICERGGTTDGGWHRGEHVRIPVAFNSAETVAITCTGGTEGTGEVEGEPSNRSLKGPNTKVASRPVEQLEIDFGDLPVDFWFFLTHLNSEGLWAEMACPIMGDDGYVQDFHERIILGKIDPDEAPRRHAVLPPASSPPAFEARRRSA